MCNLLYPVTTRLIHEVQKRSASAIYNYFSILLCTWEQLERSWNTCIEQKEWERCVCIYTV